MEKQITFDSDHCSKCGLCGEVCPNKIIEMNTDKMSTIEDRTELCFACCLCMCICPTSAIKVRGLSYEKNFYDLPPSESYEDSYYKMLITRRSIRNFKDLPVPKEMLEKIVQAITYAPVGFPPIKTKIIVVQDPAIIRKSLPYMVDLYDFLYKTVSHPIGRFFVRRKVGKSKFNLMKSHLFPMLKIRLPGLKNKTEDTITRNAPAMILFHADKNGEDLQEDIYIAATYGMLAAHAIGLGGTIMDIIPPAINKKNELKTLFQVPEHHDVIASIILGFPKYTYEKGIKRELKSVKWILT